MCGICGILTSDPAKARAAVERMTRRLAHRGPDACGIEMTEAGGGATLALGHRRLSILDLSESGNQPMRDRETGNSIVFNGEIYNFKILRARLQAEGVVFCSGTDTEVILRGYGRWGVRILKALSGMFAFALHDAARNRLLLARDALGIKPLYFGWAPDQSFLFSSEIRSLAVAGPMRPEVDRTALAACLAYGAVQEPQTILKDVRLLKAGEWMEVETVAGAPVRDYGRFWSFPEPGSFRGSREDAVRELRIRLDGAVEGHLLSDVPVGLFLSAGVDSSALASVCHRLGRSIESWTFSMDGAVDESPVAVEVAKRFGLPHKNVAIPLVELPAEGGRFIETLDQPTVDGFNTWLMAQACRKNGRKVALSGLGGDELFGGYTAMHRVPWMHRANVFAQLLPTGLRCRLAELLGGRGSPCQREKLVELLVPPRRLSEVALARRRLFSRAALLRLGLEEVEWSLNRIDMPLEADIQEVAQGRDPVAAMGVLESAFYMRNMLLRDADVCGMAHGVEIRVPWLDKELVELAFSFSGRWRQPKGRVNKPLLIEAADVPSFVFNRRKTGFVLPYKEWLKGPWLEWRKSAAESLASRGILDPEGIRTVVRDFEKRPDGPEWSRVWMLMVLDGWWTSFFKEGGAP